jgi:hypothetical protein
MERRVLIAIFLSFLVLYVYQTYVVKPAPKPAPARCSSVPVHAPPSSGRHRPGAGRGACAPAAALVGDAVTRYPSKLRM